MRPVAKTRRLAGTVPLSDGAGSGSLMPTLAIGAGKSMAKSLLLGWSWLLDRKDGHGGPEAPHSWGGRETLTWAFNKARLCDVHDLGSWAEK